MKATETKGTEKKVVPTTIDLPKDLHASLKIKAVKLNTTLRALIIDLLQKNISKKEG